MITKPLNEFVKRTNGLLDERRLQHADMYKIHGDSYIASILASELIQLQDQYDLYKSQIRKRKQHEKSN